MWSSHLLATWISSILLELVMERPRVLWLIWHGFGTYCHLFMIYEEFYTRFENLLNQIPEDISLKDGVIVLLQYTKSFEGKFGFMLRDKSPKILVEAQEHASKIEENLLSSQNFTKPKTLHNVEPTQNSMTLLAQRLEQIVTDFS
jgi:hypothetical protein